MPASEGQSLSGTPVITPQAFPHAIYLTDSSRALLPLSLPISCIFLSGSPSGHYYQDFHI